MLLRAVLVICRRLELPLCMALCIHWGRLASDGKPSGKGLVVHHGMKSLRKTKGQGAIPPADLWPYSSSQHCSHTESMKQKMSCKTAERSGLLFCLLKVFNKHAVWEWESLLFNHAGYVNRNRVKVWQELSLTDWVIISNLDYNLEIQWKCQPWLVWRFGMCKFSPLSSLPPVLVWSGIKKNHSLSHSEKYLGLYHSVQFGSWSGTLFIPIDKA